MKKVLFFTLLFSILYAQEENVLLGEIERQFETLQGESINLEEDERGIVLMFSAQVLFSIGQAGLTDEAKASLREVSKVLSQYSSILVEIEGHADNTGSAELNQELSESRAQNVMDYLIELGIDEKNLKAVGYGKDRPIADNRTEEGRTKNRRVELVVKREVMIVRRQEPPLPEPEPEPKPQKKAGMGGRAGFNMYSFSLGDSRDDDISMGYGSGAGVALKLPLANFFESALASYFTLTPELNFYWRKMATEEYGNVENSATELTLSIPVILQFKPLVSIPFYLALGPQLDIPISAEWETKNKDTGETETRAYKDRSGLDFGIALGLGYYISEKIAADFRCVIGLSAPDRYEKDSSLNQYGLGLIYFF
jgi:outer membrane protein OmpA-like peptidoglycan-associated protein